MVLPPHVPLANASLDWDAQGRPRSLHYDDIYFSSADALGESSHVFLDGNDLPARWRDLRQSHFCVAELGFGSGLNFLNTCRLWCATATPAATLHYVACELHPLRTEDMQRLHQHWPELQAFSEELLRCCPDHSAGVHQLNLQFGAHKVCLTLLFGDAQTLLQACYGAAGWRADAWYLDGFTPRHNPALWEADLLQLVARLSTAGTTLASYSVAGVFRANLAAAGFRVAKAPGYAQKRHMLRAAFAGTKALPENRSAQAQTTVAARTVCIIGGGLAGCSTAHALAQSGWQVVLLEREPRLASQGSGNPQGILHCKPGKTDTPANRLNLHAYLHAVQHYRALATHAGLPWHACGMLQLAVTDALQQRFRQLAESGLYAAPILRYLDAEAASALAGLELHSPALHFPASGWLAPPELCARYVDHAAIRVETFTEGLQVEQHQQGWQVLAQTPEGNRCIHSAALVLCNGADVHAFAQTRHYPVISNRGQVDLYPATAASSISMVLCGQGYLLPAQAQLQSVGGSYFVADGGAAAQQHRSALHLQQVQQISARLSAALGAQPPLHQRTGTRCITPDRMPIVGRVSTAGEGSLLPGLFINVAHGSHGLTRTPLCAALLASMLNGTPPPLPNALAELLSPQRFSLNRAPALLVGSAQEAAE